MVHDCNPDPQPHRPDRHLRARPRPHPHRLQCSARDGDQGPRRVQRVRGRRDARLRRPHARAAPTSRSRPRPSTPGTNSATATCAPTTSSTRRHYPTITFVSTAVRPTGDETFDLVGDLTIKDVTKSVTVTGRVHRCRQGPVRQHPGGLRGQHHDRAQRVRRELQRRARDRRPARQREGRRSNSRSPRSGRPEPIGTDPRPGERDQARVGGSGQDLDRPPAVRRPLRRRSPARRRRPTARRPGRSRTTRSAPATPRCPG